MKGVLLGDNIFERSTALEHEVAHGYWADCGESVDMLLKASLLVVVPDLTSRASSSLWPAA